MKNDIFSSILGQPEVRNYLRSSLDSNHFSQSYLFLGPSGSNKTLAARALAYSYLFPEVAKSKSFADIKATSEWKQLVDNRLVDLKYFEPEGQNGYLVSQVRDIIHDAELAPVRGSRKAYIIDRVDMLGTSAANAFLKTLEEPSDDVLFILLGRTSETVLPTIKSRCVVVPFRHIPPSEAVAIIVQNTGVDDARARAAIGVSGGSISRAIEFLRNRSMWEVYDKVARTILDAPNESNWGNLKASQDILEIMKAPNDELRRKNEEKLADDNDFLSSAAKKSLEQSQKREVRRKEKQNISMIPNIAISLLDDVFEMKNGRGGHVSNSNYMRELSILEPQTTLNKLVDAIEETNRLASVMAYNVSLESCIDLTLLEFKGAFSD